MEKQSKGEALTFVVSTTGCVLFIIGVLFYNIVMF
ncbi:hypothetical protein BkAM31D_19425 [Halalkalibacter krulwichiae]|uniref:Uncharacterized protein n=2 Tax=Halalkalibacter krulwichiae TaxID=199441 RepID=A0A1X9MEG2_9BACI|nr:hypothetical protein BkAM31D_19425 [Halalkalibacter krulwichiae]